MSNTGPGGAPDPLDPGQAQTPSQRQHENRATDRRTTAQPVREGAKALKAASEDPLSMMRQVNAQLVIATIEAQKLAEQVETAKVQLENAKRVAEKANLAKSDFLSSMSHELRTPLNTILGFAQLMESDSPPPTPSQAQSIQKILQAGWYLLELIDEILDLAAIESGQPSLLQEAVPLIEVMHECQAMIEPQTEQRGIHIEFLPFDASWRVLADRTRLKQVLINLLSNAIKYNRAQGTIEVKCSASSPQRIRISIKDSGAGLPAEKLAQLFQPFNRLGQETGTEQGTGIGLVVTRQLVELMGGTIGVKSQVGVGTEFWFELAVGGEPPAASSIAAPLQAAPQAREPAPPRTLLYVEDNPANLLLVEQIIARDLQISLLSASNADLGLALARAHQPQVILMDLNLPGTSGTEALKILRADPLTSHIPVLAVSANAMPQDIENGLAAGFFRYIAKPIRVDEFLASLDSAFRFSATASCPRNQKDPHDD